MYVYVIIFSWSCYLFLRFVQYYACCPEYIFQAGHNLLSYFYLFEMATILNYSNHLPVAPDYVVKVSQKPLPCSCLSSSCQQSLGIPTLLGLFCINQNPASFTFYLCNLFCLLQLWYFLCSKNKNIFISSQVPNDIFFFLGDI